MTGSRPFIVALWSIAAALAASGVLGGPAFGQALGGAASPETPWWRAVGALLFCLALAVGGAFALRARLRIGPTFFSPRPRRLRLVENLRLNHQVDVCLFSCDDKEFMVAATAQAVVLLQEGPAAQASEPP